jgi:mono/diheme cytochrome c family protein
MALTTFLGLTLLSGCGNGGYPEYLTYPVRTDAIVTELPKENPATLDTPGLWGELVPQLLAKGGKVVDPLMTSQKAQVQKLEEEQKKAPNDSRKDEIGKLNKRISGWDKQWARLQPDLEKGLTDLFGTPANPKVGNVEEDVLKTLVLDPTTLAQGSQLYRQQCLHCHGLTGDGRGPTAPWVNPHPRDYRRGTFKFISTIGGNARKPLLKDLLRTLHAGIDGTSMPSFGQLHEDDLKRMVSYVIHLSIRGQTELETIRALWDNFDEQTGDLNLSALEGGAVKGQLEASLGNAVKQWMDSQKSPIVPAAYPYSEEERYQSIVRGYNLFAQPGPASCVSCHADYGRQFGYRWDDWGTIVRPADLTQGIYRGGRRPVDLYDRMHGGILGAGMPAFSKQNGGSLEPNQLWDIVNFIQALPYPQMLEKADPAIRNVIYPRQTPVIAE